MKLTKSLFAAAMLAVAMPQAGNASSFAISETFSDGVPGIISHSWNAEYAGGMYYPDNFGYTNVVYFVQTHTCAASVFIKPTAECLGLSDSYGSRTTNRPSLAECEADLDALVLQHFGGRTFEDCVADMHFVE